jgi:DNA-binding response OmpR family regulator
VRILIVEDDPGIAGSLDRGLRRAGYATETVGTVDGARAAEAYDVVLLDLGLPDGDGLEFCVELRARSDAAILVITARGEEPDRVAALDAGADDYIVKPFAMQEVVARLQALLRRRPAGEGEALETGDLRLDPRARSARRGERVLDLTRREFELLEFLMRHPGQVVERKRLHEEVWGYTFDPGTNIADVFVGYLRRKLEAGGEPRVLHTVRGIGFVLRS